MKAGYELDALVAKEVFGCNMKSKADELSKAKDQREYERLRFKQDFWCDCGRGEHNEPDDDCSGEWIKPYSTDIKFAWEIVERLCSSFYMRLDDSDSHWAVSLDQKRRTEFDCGGKGYAETAPHAICLAALDVVGFKVD